jgi:hypothetical protein
MSHQTLMMGTEMTLDMLIIFNQLTLLTATFVACFGLVEYYNKLQLQLQPANI